MTPKRQALLHNLERLSDLYPDMRLGQLIVNLSNWATHRPDSTWDAEDEELLAAAVNHLEKRGQIELSVAPSSHA